MDKRQEALLLVGRILQATGYRFTTPTPLTHSRVLQRGSNANSLRDVFGWSKTFVSPVVGDEIFSLLRHAEALLPAGDAWRSAVRFSSAGDQLFVHSAYPTDASGAVFFGPDTYRFIGALRKAALGYPDFQPTSVLDIGAGSGAGGLAAARIFPSVRDILLVDVNQEALRFSEVNAALNAMTATTLYSDVCSAVGGKFDLVVSNPPYLIDQTERAYRHGGGSWGEDLSIRILEGGIRRLSPHGKLLLYTGTPVVEGKDMFLKRAAPVLEREHLRYRYEEIDPDVFGEELENAPYDRADRIATVGLFVEQGS